MKNTSSTIVVQPIHTLKEEVIIRGIKILDIAFITFLYGIVALIFAGLLDEYVYKHISFQPGVEDKDKTKLVLVLETLVCLAITGVVAYMLRNILQLVPFPLNGVYGFDHQRVPELRSGNIISVILIFFAYTFRNKMIILQSKISNVKKVKDA